MTRRLFRFGIRTVYSLVSIFFIQRPTRRVLGDRHWCPRRSKAMREWLRK